MQPAGASRAYGGSQSYPPGYRRADGKRLEGNGRLHTRESLASAKRRIDHWSVGAAPATTAIPLAVPPAPDAAWVRAALPPDAAAEIDALVRAGQPVVAIKLLREHTGFGLKASSELIDDWPSVHGL